MTVEAYNELIKQVIAAGYEDEIKWASEIKTCDSATDFFQETCWVIINSGMKEQIARLIWERIKYAWASGDDSHSVFKHKGKCNSMENLRAKYLEVFSGWKNAEDKIGYLKAIPFIGNITVWHLAKNLGMDVCKPDRHLVRVAAQYGVTPEQLCKELSEKTGDRIATVDTVIWRACNLQII